MRRLALRHEWAYHHKLHLLIEFKHLQFSLQYRHSKNHTLFGWLCSMSTMHEEITYRGRENWMAKFLHRFLLYLHVYSIIWKGSQTRVYHFVCLLSHGHFFLFPLQEIPISCERICRELKRLITKGQRWRQESVREKGLWRQKKWDAK